MTLTAPLPTDVEGEAPPSGGGEDVRKGSWTVSIVLLIVVLWLIPTIGVLVTSFRPEAAVETTGWWTAFKHLFDPAQWTLDNYSQALDTAGFQNAFLNSLAVTIPSVVIPITIAAFAAYAFSWMEFRGRYVMFVAVVGLLDVPLQMALIPILRLYTGEPDRRGADLPGPRTQRHLPGDLVGAHRIRPAAGRLPVAQLHRLTAVVDHRVGQMDGADHFTIFGGSSSPCRCRRSRPWRSSSSSGVERPLGGAHLPGRHSRTTGVLTDRTADLNGSRMQDWAIADFRRVHHDGAALGRVLRTAALLHPRAHRRGRQGMTD